MKIIGLSGYARSGKDEAANVLVEEFGYIRISYADKLRDALYALNPIVDFTIGMNHSDHTVTRKGGVMHSAVLVQDVIDDYGWDGYKETPYGPEIRRLLQRLGTEAGRQTLWDSIWVDAAFAGIPEDANIVVTDVRFPNEAEAVKAKGGVVWRVSRDGIGPATAPDGSVHKSETSIDDWKFDYHLWNNGTLEDYREDVREVMDMYARDREKWKIAFDTRYTLEDLTKEA